MMRVWWRCVHALIPQVIAVLACPCPTDAPSCCTGVPHHTNRQANAALARLSASCVLVGRAISSSHLMYHHFLESQSHESELEVRATVRAPPPSPPLTPPFHSHSPSSHHILTAAPYSESERRTGELPPRSCPRGFPRLHRPWSLLQSCGSSHDATRSRRTGC